MLEKICARCGKHFFPTYHHVFREGDNLYCTWTCFNHRDDDKKKKPRRTKIKRVGQYTESGELVELHQSAAKAGEKTGYFTPNIREACRLQKPYKGYLWRYEGSEDA